jgi:hypothetical protein
MSRPHTNFVSRSLLLLPALLFLGGAVFGQAVGYAITNVTVINPGTGNPQPDRTIVVSGHTITAVVPSTEFKPTASVRLIDGHGKLCISAMWGAT